MYLYSSSSIHHPSSYFSFLTHLFPISLFSLIQMLPIFLLPSLLPFFYPLVLFHLYSYIILFLLHFIFVSPPSSNTFSAKINRHCPPISWLFPWLTYRPKPNLAFSYIKNHFPWWAYSPALKIGAADFSRLSSKQPISTWRYHPNAHHASLNHQKINMS